MYPPARPHPRTRVNTYTNESAYQMNTNELGDQAGDDRPPPRPQDFDISDNTRKEAAIAAMEAPLVPGTPPPPRTSCAPAD